jgi:NADPH-dependent curcumin reductase CurA
MKHYKTSFKGEKSPNDIHAAVGRNGAMVTRIHVANGETQVYFTGGDADHKHLRSALGAADPAEVREDEVRKIR